MQETFKRNHREGGVALVIALLVLAILSVLAASVMLVTQTETWSATNNRSMLQARYAAEAGAQKALNYLRYNYVAPANPAATFNLTKYPAQFNGNDVVLSAMTGVNANYPDAAVQTAFRNTLMDASVPGVGVPASYEVTAKLLSIRAGVIQTWEITSQGNVPSVRNAQVQVVMRVERSGTPLLTYAVFGTGNGCADLNLSGGALTNSFDSSAGTYAATAQASGGDVGSNGNVTLGGATTQVQGNISVLNPTQGACAAGADITSSSGAGAFQGTTTLSAPQTYPLPLPISPAAPTTNQSYAANTTLPPGNYGNVNMSGGKTLTLSPGTYNLNSLVLSGNSQLQISPPGQVIINIQGTGAVNAVDLSGGTIANTSDIPLNLQINYDGSQPILLSGGSGSYGIVYAPNSPITISGGADWYGAVLGKSFTDSGGSAVHFDRSLLQNLVLPGPYYPISFTWSKF
jgi:Tfp pilus assembly protein PilX